MGIDTASTIIGGQIAILGGFLMFGAMAATPWAQYDSNDSFEINILDFIIFTDHENMGIDTTPTKIGGQISVLRAFLVFGAMAAPLIG